MYSPRILILGHARHGKDTAAELLASELGLSFRSSSLAAAEKAVYPVLQRRYGYQTLEECYADRGNHRAEWHELIAAYNHPAYRLAREILDEVNIYVGMRSKRELNACKDMGLFDYIVTVDASKRMFLEGSNSLNINVRGEADYIIDNNGSEEVLPYNVRAIAKQIKEAPYGS